MKKHFRRSLLSLLLCVLLVVPSMEVLAGPTYYDNKTGNEDGYDYELWKDYGNTSMTLNGGGAFSCSWSNIGNCLFRKGRKFDSSKSYQQIGNISFDYGCNYQPNGNSYLCVYGWTVSPLVEYYIVDSWGTWRPPGASSKGTINVDGGTYEVYETTRYNQPSIQGNTTFQQYWSVRTSKRTSGTITVSEHFKAWERMGMRVGNLYEAALNIEGYQSSGTADVYKNNMTIGGSYSGGGSSQGGGQGQGGGNENAGNNLVEVANADKLQCENMTISGQYAGKISNPFNGVALYGNNDEVSFTQNFTKGTHDFTLRGCSNNDNMARVDLVIGGETKGTFYYGDANPAEYTIKNVSHKTGNQKVELIVTADDGQWDGYIDWLGIGGISSEGGSSQGGGQQGQGQGQGGNSGTTPTTSGGFECENMTISGQYAGKISSPFSGVALYANNDKVSFTQNFTSSTNDFTLRGCSNNDNMARVDLVIGGQTKGTFYYGDANTAEYTIKNVSHGTGNQKIELVVTADDGQWDAYIDALMISGISSGSGTSQGGGQQGQGGNQGQEQGQGGNQGTTEPVSTGATIQCESMTKSGQYTGNVSSPFTGVALYGNNDKVSFTQNFTTTSDSFTLRGCSNNGNMARVDLVIGGQTKGTFYYGDEYPAEYTIENVSHGTGNQKVELVVTADNGQWDAYIDYLKIGGASSNNSSTPASGNTKPTGKLIALTFDDGPSTTTPYVLDVLEQKNAVATFFLIGSQVNGNTKSIMQRQLNMGCELACHSYDHQDMSGMGSWEVQQQISRTVDAIKSQVNTEVKFFRAPYLATSNTMFQNINLAFIQGFDVNDWESSTSTQARVNGVLSKASDGAIVLLHDFQGNNNTVEALGQIIDGLRNQGYTLVTLSELFAAKGVNPNQRGKVWSNTNN